MAKKKTSVRPNGPLTKADYERLAELRYLLRRFLIFSENAAEQAGLTAQQHQALLAIKGYPGRDEVAVGELAERLGIRHASAVGLIDRLVAKGLVTRRSGSVDRRQILIRLTSAAEARLSQLSVTHRAELKRLGPLLHVLLTELGTGMITRDRALVF
jgi:DNA-binding MarR family transcriptional regulator